MTTLETVSKKLSNLNPAWLWSLIRFESNANPAARNPITGARGLIQFLHSTARSMGFKNADDLVIKYPTFDKQLKGPVYAYLKKYAPFPSKQSLYMAVFYPAARSWSSSTVFPANVRTSNPGIDTVQDYINFVEGKGRGKKSVDILALAVFAAAIGIIYHLSKGKKL